LTPAGKLIDQLKTLKDTREQRAVERENERVRQEEEHRTWIKRAGRGAAVDNIEDIKRQILRVAERNDATDYEIPIQTTMREYSLDEYDSAYAEKLADLFRNEGLAVEWVRTTQEPGQGSYYSFSETRYSTSLKVSW
jgi:hypothetical protein